MFSDYRENPEILLAVLRKIYIHAKTYLHSIQCEYRGPENKKILSNKHGSSGDAPLYIFELDSEEYITKIRGRSGKYINQLQFFTNKGRISPPYGGSGGNLFIWTLDEKRHPDSPGLHHFEGTSGKYYIQTLQASFPIYPWFEDSRQATVRDNTNLLDVFALDSDDMFTIKEVCDVIMDVNKHTTKIVQCIRADTVSKLLRESKRGLNPSLFMLIVIGYMSAESRSYILEYQKILEMLKCQEASALHCGLMIIAELARLGKDIENIFQINVVRNLLMDKERFVLLQKLSEQEAFKNGLMHLLPDLMGLLTDNNVSVSSNAGVIIGYLSEQPTFHTSIQGAIEENQLIELLQHKEYLVRSTSITLLAKLSEQVRSQPFVINAFSSIIHLLEDSVSYVRMTAADAIGKFVDQGHYYSVLEGLRPVIGKHITDIIPRLTGLLNHEPYEQSSGRITLLKLSQQDDFREAIFENLPNLLSLCDKHLSVRANTITLLKELADDGKTAAGYGVPASYLTLAQARYTNEILHLLRHDILTSSRPYDPSIWVSVLAMSSTLLDQLKHDEKIDYYVSQMLVGMSVDENESIQDRSGEIVVKLLRYVKEPSVVYTLVDLTRSSKNHRFKLNGVTALLTVMKKGLSDANFIIGFMNIGVPETATATYRDSVNTLIRDTIPELIEMLLSDSNQEGTRVVTILQEIVERPEFQQEVGKIILKIIRLLEQNPRSPAICPGMELLRVFLGNSEVMQVIPSNYTVFNFLSTLMRDADKDIISAGLSLAMKILSMDDMLPRMPQLLALGVHPLHIRAMFMLGDTGVNHKGIMILSKLSMQGRKTAVMTMVKELCIHIADSSKAKAICDPTISELHIDGGDKLLQQLSEEGEI
ncbi:hypothetical protein Clacol_008800 [Clathrus columnatus]|uniref:Jacalin-type lectin domain-containing protein n=1 Tax=Clathrus columnatus TaxID=1419009 RepID=A0AAV5AJH8_9AGAM|nr:hypothetical protein Clacol_008800 [Clathrus columnatus]